MNNILISGLPISYKGYSLNTGYREALSILNLLEDPRINKKSDSERLAAYIAAFSILYVDSDIFSDRKLGIVESINGLNWWLSCGHIDRVENYWRKNGIAPDIEDNAFDIKDYNAPDNDIITVEQTIGNEHKFVEMTKYSTLSFEAPDGTTRYFKRSNGEPDLISLYEDAELIYSAFLRIFNIDIMDNNIHWFKFSMLLAELEATEGTAFADKIKLRSFNPDNYKGKEYNDYRGKMLKAKHDNRVLGILPYVYRGK